SILLRHSGTQELVIRGAPEAVLALCKNQEACAQLAAWSEGQGTLGRRVLAIAVRTDVGSLGAEYEAAEEAVRVQVLGAISFADPIKPSTAAAIAEAEALGLRIKILTGDSREVAIAVGKETGLIKDESQVMTGRQ